ncbi:sulfurtransferase [Halohasta salina]|uniref:sulfurtransferase n=1 Tax=Halohasta salina TaxID=2961621 RepID=UPI0020A30626|nr:sulfurtransferase [Halohasta salina]
MSTDLLVDPSWVADRLDEPSVRLVDVREAWEYDAMGHLPGAVSIPFDRYREDDSPDPGTLPGSEAFVDLLAAAGIAPDDTIVAYDDTHGVFAARLVLTALVYGHGDVRLLNGDFSAWRREYEVTDATPDIEPADYEPRGIVADAPIVDRAAVADAIDGGETTLLDTREAWEYEEGHLPGAIRLDWMELVDEETRGVKSRDDIETLLADRGIPIDRERRIVLYCNTSRRLSHTFVVLRSLGFEDVAVYEGSMSEWTDAGGVVETERSD